jgi:transmembrane 9 superfamily protein 2/4
MPLDYYVLPFCRPKDGIKMDNANLGQSLVGDRIESSPYYIEMKRDMYCEQLCIGNLGRAEMPNMAPNKMVKAIRNGYRNNWIVDNLPSASKIEDDLEATTRHWQGFPVGFVATDTKLAYIHNHVNIEIDYHPVENEARKYRVVGFTVEPLSIKHDFEATKEWEDDIKDDEHVLPAVAKIRNPIASCAGKPTEHTSYEMVTAPGRIAQEASGSVLFTYDVKWNESPVTWAHRWDVYLYVLHRLPLVALFRRAKLLSKSERERERGIRDEQFIRFVCSSSSECDDSLSVAPIP